MVQAIVNLGEHQDRLLNIIKGKFGLKNKSDAMNFVINKYEEELLEPELRPEYVGKLKKIQKEPTIKIGTIENFRKRYGIN